MLLKDKIPIRYIFGGIKYELAATVVYTIVLWFLYTRFHLSHLAMSLSVPAILGTVLSLLLGFRSNQAYDRWWEARQVWGSIVNDSRSVARQILTFAGRDYHNGEVKNFRERFIKRQIAWAHSLGQSLRGHSGLGGIEEFLTIEEYRHLEHYKNVPAAILALHGSDLKTALAEQWINRYQQVAMDEMLTRLCDAQGKCERIKNTVFPVTYSLYIHFSMILFIGLLPLGLIEYFDVFVVPAVAAIAACFLLIEKMAIHLQDPFDNKPTDTPVTTIAKNIERELEQMIDDRYYSPVQASKGKEEFYIM